MRRDGGGSDPKFYFLSSVDLKEEKMYIGKSLEINKHHLYFLAVKKTQIEKIWVWLSHPRN